LENFFLEIGIFEKRIKLSEKNTFTMYCHQINIGGKY
jgi:hypothetical protein